MGRALATSGTLAWLGACSILATACTGSLAGGLGGDAEEIAQDASTEPTASARATFDESVLPLLDQNCRVCHVDPAHAPAFLLPNPDVYSTVKVWPLLVQLDAPEQSRLTSKGQHDGPAWSVDEAATIRSWIDLEVMANGGAIADAGVEEDAGPPDLLTFTPAQGPNTVPLLPMGLPGSTLTFDAEWLDGDAGVYLSGMMVNAGAGGVHLVNPEFMPTAGDPVALEGVDLRVEPGASQRLDDGTVVVSRLTRQGSITVHFEVAETLVDLEAQEEADGLAGVEGGPCDLLAQFTQFAQPELSANCRRCHGGDDDEATQNLDMTAIDDLSLAGQDVACHQVLARVRVDAPMDSAIFLVTDPEREALHPFDFGGDPDEYSDFQQAVLHWIGVEQ